jgi:ribosomal protein S18 acetylase RimI-like enzyme
VFELRRKDLDAIRGVVHVLCPRAVVLDRTGRVRSARAILGCDHRVVTLITVRAVAPERWQEYRDLRLAALTLDPDAFASTLTREAGFTSAQWRERCTNPDSFIGYLDGRPVALAGLLPSDGPRRELVGVWTAPTARGHGVAEEVCRAAIQAAEKSGSTAVVLLVAGSADSARRLYRRLGFVETGHTEPMPRDESLLLTEMVLRLANRQ